MSSRSSRKGLADGPSAAVNELLEEIGLVDHHVHSIVHGRVEPPGITAMLNESDRQSAADAAGLDTQLGIAVRRWCAPLLGLPASIAADAYLEHRRGIDNEEAARMLLPAAGFERLLVDTGFHPERLVDPADLGRMAGAPVNEVIRLEALAERVVSGVSSAAGFTRGFGEALAGAAMTAVGLKSIIAYRCGLDFDPAPPAIAEVDHHAGAWLREIEATGRIRLADPVLLRFVLWEGARTGLPLQVHVGFGDPDLDLHRSDPLLMTDFLRATEDVCPILLLHTYPFHRNAGYLAQMFHHVFLDAGLAINHAGVQSAQVIAETLELAPFTKLLFSSDAWGLPELHLLGSWLFRRGLARVVGPWVEAGDWSLADASRAIGLIAAGNARRIYGLD